MPDLHEWITQQIERVEANAQDAAPIPWPADMAVIHNPGSVLRRCEADRRILERHRLDPHACWSDATACAGCGVYGEAEWPVTDNLNDCPELLDLAYAHGITEEILAKLDRPEPPPRPERPAPRAWVIAGKPTSSAPPVLRGPNWKDTAS